MWLKILYFIGLTNLTYEQVVRYELISKKKIKKIQISLGLDNFAFESKKMYQLKKPLLWGGISLILVLVIFLPHIKSPDIKSPEKMVLIPAGKFIKGNNPEDMEQIAQEFGLKKSSIEFLKEEIREEIYLDAFYIDKFETTNAQYKRFIDATGHRALSHWKHGTYPPYKKNHPAVNISWGDAVAYCNWIGKRLPSQLEWEKAARGIDGRLYPWGNRFDKERCNTDELELNDTLPVGSYENSKSPYDVYDMAGNVAEWTSTSKNGGRIICGGSWYQTGEIYSITSIRFSAEQNITRDDIGFRCAKDR